MFTSIPIRRSIKCKCSLADGPDLRAIAQAEGPGEAGAAVGIEGGMGPRAADGDIGGAGINGVGAEALHVRHHPIARRAQTA